MQVFQLKNCYIRFWPETGHTVTVFPPDGKPFPADGPSSGAGPNYDAEYLGRMEWQGYKDIPTKCLGHELCHSVVSEALGHPYSPVIYADAHKILHTLTEQQGADEEGITLAFERFLNGYELYPAYRQQLEEAGASPEAVREQILAIMKNPVYDGSDYLPM